MTQGTQTGLYDRLKDGIGREVQEGGDMDVPMADFYSCLIENKIL